MTTEAGYDLTPGRTWGTTTKVSLVIRGPDELDACIVDEWRSLLRSMTLTKGGWPVPDTSIQIHLTKENVLALEDEMRALGLT